MANDVPAQPRVETAGRPALPAYQWLKLPLQSFDLNGPLSRPYVAFDRRQIEAPLFGSIAETAARTPEGIAIGDDAGDISYSRSSRPSPAEPASWSGTASAG